MHLWRIVWVLIVLVTVLGGVYFLFPGTIVNADKSFELWRAGLAVHDINVDDQHIHYVDSGGQGRVVLMLHGFAADYYSWPRMARYMKAGYRVIAPDLPGFGQSSRIAADNYGISQQAQRMHDFLRALNVDKVDIVGNSMGGWIAAEFAARFPAQTRTLTLIDTGGITAPHPSPFMQAVEKGENPLVVHNRAQFNHLLTIVFHHQPFIPGPLKGYFAKQAVEHAAFNEKVFKDLTDDYVDLEPLLPKLTMPTLVMWGRYDQILDPSCVEVLKAGLPNATIKWFDTGHAPMLEQPKASAEVLKAFLQANRGD